MTSVDAVGWAALPKELPCASTKRTVVAAIFLSGLWVRCTTGSNGTELEQTKCARFNLKHAHLAAQGRLCWFALSSAHLAQATRRALHLLPATATSRVLDGAACQRATVDAVSNLLCGARPAARRSTQPCEPIVYPSSRYECDRTSSTRQMHVVLACFVAP